MAKVHITNVVVLDNPSSFFNPFQFELTFECIEELKEDLEWKMIYVGSAESEEHDQVLDTIYVGPVPEGDTSLSSRRIRQTSARSRNRMRWALPLFCLPAPTAARSSSAWATM